MRRSLNGRILKNTILNILVLVVVCCVIMAAAMQSLANSILLDSLQPMARQSAKTVEANIHMLADRMMTIAGDPRMNPPSGDEAGALRESREEALTEAAEIYELYTIALYGLDGRLVQGTSGAPDRLEDGFFSLLRETDNLTTDGSTRSQGRLGITMGMPVKADGETILYVVGVYKYDTLNDVISSINLGRHGTAYMVSHSGDVTGHPDQSLVLSGATISQLTGGNQDAALRATSDETGAAEFPVDGQTMLAAFSPIRGTRWSLVIQVPKADYASYINGAMLVAVLATAAVLAVSILLVLRLARSISQPVRGVTDRMVALSGGDLHTAVLQVRSGDELEVLTHTLGDTVESVNRYISDIQQVLTRMADGDLTAVPQVDYRGDFTLIRSSLGAIRQSMNETILGFRNAAGRLAEMSEELSGQSTQLHQASLEQTQSTEELVDEVSRVKDRLSSVKDSSGQTRTKTAEIAQCIQDANTRMDALSRAMDGISDNAQRITQIAKAIEDVAFQTGILAINASVEAARAGSAGKGFAVVADEVRNLANRSDEAAKATKDLIESSIAAVAEGSGVVDEVTQSLGRTSQSAEGVSTKMAIVVEAVEKQTSAISQVTQGIDQISSVVQTNSATSEESAAASQELSSQASLLKNLVAAFRLR